MAGENIQIYNIDKFKMLGLIYWQGRCSSIAEQLKCNQQMECANPPAGSNHLIISVSHIEIQKPSPQYHPTHIIYQSNS